MDRSEILEFAKAYDYENIRDMNMHYKNYEVYEPCFALDKIAYVGLPLFILVRGDDIRMSTRKEADKILRICAQQQNIASDDD